MNSESNYSLHSLPLSALPSTSPPFSRRPSRPNQRCQSRRRQTPAWRVMRRALKRDADEPGLLWPLRRRPGEGAPISMRRVASWDAAGDWQAPPVRRPTWPQRLRPKPRQTELTEAASAHMEPVITPPSPPQHNTPTPLDGARAECASLAAREPRGRVGVGSLRGEGRP